MFETWTAVSLGQNGQPVAVHILGRCWTDHINTINEIDTVVVCVYIPLVCPAKKEGGRGEHDGGGAAAPEVLSSFSPLWFDLVPAGFNHPESARHLLQPVLLLFSLKSF